MKAITIVPGTANSVSVQDVPEPPTTEGTVLVRALELGICGTDFELISAEYGWPPRGSKYLILGHESLGVVEDAPAHVAVKKGDLVVGIVRHPDPVPCIACAVGEWDMCRNMQYTERGIKEINGFGSQLWRSDPAFLVKIHPKISDLGVLMEPATILAKAWDHIERIGERAFWKPKTVLVTGAGPVGLLAALGGMQRGLEVHVLDRVTGGLKPQLVHDLGGKYHTGPLAKLGFTPDIVIECTGATELIVEAINLLSNYGILCLTGVSNPGRQQTLDIGNINRTMVLENCVIFGTVNANRRHYQMAADMLAQANSNWLSRLISRREPLSNWQKAFERHPDDIKVIIDFDHR